MMVSNPLIDLSWIIPTLSAIRFTPPTLVGIFGLIIARHVRGPHLEWSHGSVWFGLVWFGAFLAYRMRFKESMNGTMARGSTLTRAPFQAPDALNTLDLGCGVDEFQATPTPA